MGNTARSYLRTLRTEVRRCRARDQDWRDVIGALRPHTSQLWRRLTLDERKRFLRHLRSYWDVMRHRCAPAAHDVMVALKQCGQFSVFAARLRGVTSVLDGLEVKLELRGTGALQRQQVQVIVNCTGPDQRCSAQRVAVDRTPA
jgi:uncharacterized NAD(P)/FAD-binding protein YdhS